MVGCIAGTEVAAEAREEEERVGHHAHWVGPPQPARNSGVRPTVLVGHDDGERRKRKGRERRGSTGRGRGGRSRPTTQCWAGPSQLASDDGVRPTVLVGQHNDRERRRAKAEREKGSGGIVAVVDSRERWSCDDRAAWVADSHGFPPFHSFVFVFIFLIFGFQGLGRFC